MVVVPSVFMDVITVLPMDSICLVKDSFKLVVINFNVISLACDFAVAELRVINRHVNFLDKMENGVVVNRKVEVVVTMPVAQGCPPTRLSCVAVLCEALAHLLRYYFFKLLFDVEQICLVVYVNFVEEETEPF